jgi:hypothetical protein
MVHRAALEVRQCIIKCTTATGWYRNNGIRGGWNGPCNRSGIAVFHDDLITITTTVSSPINRAITIEILIPKASTWCGVGKNPSARLYHG